MSKRNKYIKSCEISEVTAVRLGGYEQKILIEGKSKSLPVVIMLHGGPGSPVPFSVGCRGLFPEWTDKAVMVYWDQLGCGINNYKLDDGFRIENFVDMTCDLIDYIKQRFPQNKLFLFGVSWGSVLALKAAVRVPEKLDGAFVYGQVLKNLFFNDEVARSFDNAPPKARQTVQNILEVGTNCKYEILDKNLN
ncbi:MAG: alpha/beta fold hydrolase, partial [Firmicutes bacterium]|nr:alpha/beta fold hydrolase [Bacillota bacterium]